MLSEIGRKMQITTDNGIVIVTPQQSSITELCINTYLHKLLTIKDYFAVIFHLRQVAHISPGALKVFSSIQGSDDLVFVSANEDIKNIFKIHGCYEQTLFFDSVFEASENLRKKQINLKAVTIQNTLSNSMTITDASQLDNYAKTLVISISNSYDDLSNNETICDEPSNDLQKLWASHAAEIKNASLTHKGKRSLLLDEDHTKIITDSEGELSNDEHKPRFSCNKEIARGGMGVIFEGYQNNLQREIAIKKLIKTFKDKQDKKDMFLSESMTTAYLDHPNIVPVYDLEQQNDEIHLAMKLIKGVSWSQDLRKYELEKNLQILLQVCNAVAFAHSKGIIHCDLKPENVMIGQFGEITVMDWGVSVSMEKSSVAPYRQEITTPMGTPVYFSPELANGQGSKIGPWTDVYLLGAILCEILTGHPPHQAQTVFMTFCSAAEGRIPKFPDTAPQKLIDICCKALNPAKYKRYPSVLSFQRDIEDYLQHSKSILLSEQAQKNIENCKISDANAYDIFTEAYFDFRQALKLWNKNLAAQKGKEQACLQHAKAAMHREEFNLAETLLQKLSDTNAQKTQLQNEIQTAKNLKQGRDIAQKLFKLCLFFCCAIAIKFAIIPFETEAMRDIILSDAPMAFRACIWIFFLSFCYFFYRSKQSFTINIRVSILFQVVGSFLLFLGIFFAKFPYDFPVVGIFPPALWILFINILIPYTWKEALAAQVFTLTSLGATVLYFSSNLPPDKIFSTLISQMVIVCFISVLLRLKK